MSDRLDGAEPAGFSALCRSGIYAPLSTRGTVNASTLVLRGTPTTPGAYIINLQAWEKVNASGDRSSVFPYTVVVTGTTLTAPRITTEPANQTVEPGADVTFTVVATGSPEPAYLWRKNNVTIAGATSASLTLREIGRAHV